MKIGDQFVKVENYEPCMIVYIREESLKSAACILVKHQNSGREWLTKEQLKNDFVEK